MRVSTGVLAAGVAALLAGAAARGDGIMVAGASPRWKTTREQMMINEPEQKAVVFFRHGREDLIISPSFAGAPDRFAWLVPVPARPKVRIVEGALFHELAALTVPKADALPQMEQMKAMAGARAPSDVTVLERQTVGAYDVTVLTAGSAGSLMAWLSQNGYSLPPAAEEPARRYVREGWTFVACRIKTPANAAAGLASGTLAPLRLTFPAERPIYPMRLSAANPEEFTVCVYLLLPASETGGSRDSIPLADAPAPRAGESTPLKATLAAEQGEYPTLADLTPEEVNVYREYVRLDPSESTRDFVWAPTRGRPIGALLLVPGLVAGAAGAWSLLGWRRAAAARAAAARWRAT